MDIEKSNPNLESNLNNPKNGDTSNDFTAWLNKQHGIVDYCNRFLPDYKKIKLYFRGQSKIYDNTFLPSLYRNDRLQFNINNIYSEIFAKFYYEFKDDKTLFDKLVRMQHFKIPTKLLDVTEDILVAMFFASKDDEDDDGIIFSFFVSNNSIIYPNDPLATILSHFFRYEPKKDLYKSNFNFKIERDYAKYDMYELINVKSALRKKDDFSFASPICAAKNEINFNENMFYTNDLTGIYYAVPNYTNPRITRQRGAFVMGGLSQEDSLLKSIFHLDDISCYIDNLQHRSVESLINDISKKDFSDAIGKGYLIKYLSNYIGKDIFDLEKDLPFFTIETYKELFSERTQESYNYLEHLLFLYGLYSFDGKFSFYDAFKIPANNKNEVLNSLKVNGITESYLFPDLEYFGKEIKEKYNQ